MGKKIVTLAGSIAIISIFMTPALAQYRSYRPYPAACESVIFPRSPLCAGRPAAYDVPAPFNWIFYR
jgi:hypothetical protein